MATENGVVPRRRNRILAALPPDDWARLRSQLAPVRLGHKEVLAAPNEPIGHVYFPLSAVVSLLAVMADGAAVEAAIVGNEGVVGLPAFLGTGAMPLRAISQVPGDALRLPVAAFRAEADAAGALGRLLRRYAQGLLTEVAQGSACNRLHPMPRRCARWLLMTHDRVGVDEFPLTHEFLAQMLGVRRATVTEATGSLRRAGLIRSTQGRIAVLDRPGLEAASCECYRIIRDEFDRLLG